MKIRRVTMRNFRGIGQETVIDLDSDMILFYGPNGRGKSTLFAALELALFPRETLAELRREIGDRAPLTNLFLEGSEAEAGEVRVLLGDESAEETVTQEVRQELDRIEPASSRVVRALDGHRSQLFFTQRLLRDLMFGTPERRHARVKQLLGGDGYDGLLRALYEWHRDWDYEFEQVERESQLLAYHGERAESAEPGSVWKRLVTVGSTSRLVREYRDEVLEGLRDADHSGPHYWVAEEESPRRFADLLRRVQRTAVAVAEDMNAFQYAREVRMESEIDYRQLHSLPPAWVVQFREAQRRVEEQLAHFAEAMIPLGGDQKGRNWREEAKRTEALKRLISTHGPDDSSVQRLSAIDEQIENEIGQLEWLVEQYGAVLETLSSRLTAWQGRLLSLSELDPVLDLLERYGTSDVGKARQMNHRRQQFLRFTRYLYRALLELIDEEVEGRIKAIEGDWNSYYRSITTASHFQRLAMEVHRVSVVEAYWTEPPERWSQVRFRVLDPLPGLRIHPFRMESLLSEGQLNCAIVGLALALSKAWGSAPLRVLALDDPFVSWDDVNTENFMQAVRQLADSGTTLLLSTCDQRVVHSLRRNMETADLRRPALLYALQSWNPLYGLSYEKTVVRRRESAYPYLRQLPPDQFRGTRLARPDQGSPLPVTPTDGEEQNRKAIYYILTTTSERCYEKLMTEGRFDHLYRGQPETRQFLEQMAGEARPDVFFIFYDRIRESPRRLTLGKVFRLVDLKVDEAAGLTRWGQPKYSLFLEPVGSVNRNFEPGKLLWEVLSLTRGKRLADFFLHNSRVLIPLSATDFHQILGVR